MSNWKEIGPYKYCMHPEPCNPIPPHCDNCGYLTGKTSVPIMRGAKIMPIETETREIDRCAECPFLGRVYETQESLCKETNEVLNFEDWGLELPKNCPHRKTSILLEFK